MGLKFRIFTKAEHYTMSSPAALLRKAAAHSAAPPAAPPATSSAATVVASLDPPKTAHPAAKPDANQCREFRESGNPCSRKNCMDATCRKAKARVHTASPKHSAPPKAAGGGDGGISAQLSAMQKKIDQIEVKIDSGFEAQEKRSLALQEQGSKSYAETMQMFKAFGSMMTGGFTAINTAHRELSAPSTRLAICASGGSNATEVVEQPRRYVHSCVASNEGGSASHSSQRPQSSAACGSSANSSEFVLHKQPQTELLRSSGGSSIVAARQLGVTQRLQNFEVNFSKMKPNDFNNFVGAAIRSFVANFAPSEQDEMACVLLGMVNGKKYPVHNSIIIHSNESIFRRFFGELAEKFPRNAVKTTNAWVSAQTFSRLSTDPRAMCTLISVLCGEE